MAIQNTAVSFTQLTSLPSLEIAVELDLPLQTRLSMVQFLMKSWLKRSLTHLSPPSPPKATFDQVNKLAQALVRGEPNRDKIALTVLSDTVLELI